MSIRAVAMNGEFNPHHHVVQCIPIHECVRGRGGSEVVSRIGHVENTDGSRTHTPKTINEGATGMVRQRSHAKETDVKGSG